VEAISLLAAHAGDVMPVAGGTDLIPNMKHRLFTPGHLVSLKNIDALRGIRVDDEDLVIGATETLTDVARSELVRSHVPSLATAAAHVAGPQLRNMGTIGGNVCLDTRCTYYNQTEFWRGALGYCLKKEGTVCHVTKVGKKCVAAHSADTPPVLMTVNATIDLIGPDGTRSEPARDFFVSDGIWNSRRAPDELVTRIRIPILDRRRTGYAKLRQRESIDFPLLTVAVASTFNDDGTIDDLTGVVTGLGSRPRELSGWTEIAAGRELDPDLMAELCERAHAQCRPLENMIVDPEWRRAMVPLYVGKALSELRRH
jgi:4-hydroxybenzoyl-CoA reductase subunit beta